MTRRLPIVPTLVVAAAVATMIALGVWQLRRAEWKADLIARYDAAAHLPPLTSDEVFAQVKIDNTYQPRDPEELHFRRASFDCTTVGTWRATAGRNARGQSGFVHVAGCIVAGHEAFDGPSGEVVIGWSQGPLQPEWQGGLVSGTIAPAGVKGWRLVADPPLAGLQANAAPDPRDLPNNHLMYAGQWFFFALTALVIYVLALRKRRRQP